MAKNTIGAVWRSDVEHQGRFFTLVVTHDGEGSCKIQFETGDGPIAGTETVVTIKPFERGSRSVAEAIVEACQDDLTERLKAGELDAYIK